MKNLVRAANAAYGVAKSETVPTGRIADRIGAPANLQNPGEEGNATYARKKTSSGVRIDFDPDAHQRKRLHSEDPGDA
jgi:hypothetical protein